MATKTTAPIVNPAADPILSAEPTVTTTPEPTLSAEPTVTTTPEPTLSAEPTVTTTPEPTLSAEPTVTTTPEPTPEIRNLDDVLAEAPALTAEDSASMKLQAEAALAESARIQALSPEEYEAEFGFKFLDGISIAENTIQKSDRVHKERIFSLLKNIRELYGV